MNEIDSIVKEFLVESHENLDKLDRALVALEKDPRDSECLSSIFRTIHTIKGTCGFFGFSRLESVTHAGESLLSKLRDGLLLLDPELTSALLALVDAVRDMLASIANTGSDGNGDYQALMDRLTALQEPPTQTRGPGTVVRGPSKSVHGPRTTVPDQTIPDQTVHGPRSTVHDAAVADTNIRVDVGLLDKLMNLVGELVLARNQILQFNSTQKDSAFVGTTQRLNLITTELQEGVMKTRMQPIGTVWNRFPRVVRDLAIACGKEVRLEMEGKETELDRTIIEAIKDPLTHIVRNAVDHGIEKPAVRKANGKPVGGVLLLRAFHEGGRVNIEISDDGAGIDTELVRAKAIERGLISREQATRMSEREALQMVFLPGFSTAETITSVSGRGVGMDVVRTNIEKIGGTVDLQSQPGQGTTLKIKIPLTLAIIPALMVTSGGERFAIPQVSLLELIRLEDAQAKRGIEHIHGTPVYRLRGKLLPLVYLNHELGMAATADSRADRSARIDFQAARDRHLIVLQADDRQFGLIVDEINDTEEIVVKPLHKLFKTVPVFAGATIMGDGKVALILDVLGIAQRSGVVSEVHDRTLADLASQAVANKSDTQTLLLVGVGEDRRAAIPLSMVARLEEIPRARLEWADGQAVVQYRGQILPLIRLSGALGGDASDAQADPMQVVVYTEGDRWVGLVVDRILDIVETSLEVRQSTRRNGVVASAIIQQRVTDLLDVHGLTR